MSGIVAPPIDILADIISTVEKQQNDNKETLQGLLPTDSFHDNGQEGDVPEHLRDKFDTLLRMQKDLQRKQDEFVEYAKNLQVEVMATMLPSPFSTDEVALPPPVPDPLGPSIKQVLDFPPVNDLGFGAFDSGNNFEILNPVPGSELQPVQTKPKGKGRALETALPPVIGDFVPEKLDLALQPSGFKGLTPEFPSLPKFGGDTTGSVQMQMPDFGSFNFLEPPKLGAIDFTSGFTPTIPSPKFALPTTTSSDPPADFSKLALPELGEAQTSGTSTGPSTSNENDDFEPEKWLKQFSPPASKPVTFKEGVKLYRQGRKQLSKQFKKQMLLAMGESACRLATHLENVKKRVLRMEKAARREEIPDEKEVIGDLEDLMIKTQEPSTLQKIKVESPHPIEEFEFKLSIYQRDEHRVDEQIRRDLVASGQYDAKAIPLYVNQFRLQRISAQDDYLDQQIRKKYMNGESGGLIGTVLCRRNKQTNTTKIPYLNPDGSLNLELDRMQEFMAEQQMFKCFRCGFQFANKHSVVRHLKKGVCAKREDFFFKQLIGDENSLPNMKINRHHAQARRWDELVWGDQLILHKDMSLARINYRLSQMIGTMVSLQFDPFDPSIPLKSEMETFVFEQILFKVNKLLPVKILSQHYSIPFSEVTYLHSLESLQYIVDELEDVRCTTLKEAGDNLEKVYRQMSNPDGRGQNIFLTPNFLQTFDFHGGFDEQVLCSKIMYAACQIGIHLLNEEQENIRTLDKSERISLSQRRKAFCVPEKPYLEFKCFHGIRLDPNSLYYFEDSSLTSQVYYRDNKLQMEEFKHSYDRLYQNYYPGGRCPFFLRYQREDPGNPASPFRLIEFDLSHNHNLGLFQLRHQDVTHFADPAYNKTDNFHYPHAHWRNVYSRSRFVGFITNDKETQRSKPEEAQGKTYKVAPFKGNPFVIKRVRRWTDSNYTDWEPLNEDEDRHRRRRRRALSQDRESASSSDCSLESDLKKDPDFDLKSDD